MERNAYPSDVSDDEWAFVAPYLTLMNEDLPQREQSLREVFDGLRHTVRRAGRRVVLAGAGHFDMQWTGLGLG